MVKVDPDSDVECFPEDGKVACEVNGKRIKLVDQEALREATEGAGVDPAPPETCAPVVEDFTQRHISETFESEEQRFRAGRLLITHGCTVPYIEPEERDLDSINRARKRAGLEPKDRLEHEK